MKLFRSSLLILGCLSAFGWFLLKDISFLALLPLIPLGSVMYFINRFEFAPMIWGNGIFALLTALIISAAVSVGVFDGRGFLMVFFLMIGCALFAVKVKMSEWARVAGWWMSAFLVIFLLMTISAAMGVQKIVFSSDCGAVADILIFYLLALGESFAMGKKYRASPFALGILLIPFGIFSYFSLGKGAFCAAEYPYLSVLSGVSFASFRHLEGIILCILFGAGIFRISNFLIRLSLKKAKKSG